MNQASDRVVNVRPEPGADIGRVTALVLAIALAITLAAALAPCPAAAFDFAQVVAKAEALSTQPYQAREPVPERIAELTFTQWQAIRYRREKALWPGSNFRVQFFAAGYLFDRPVAIHIVEDGEARPFPFAQARFRYNPERIGGKLPTANMGYAGFRLLFPINRPEVHDEVASFIGASYFRAVGAGEVYGLSARGLAIDTGLPSGEEFPDFTAFWLVRPAPDAETMTVYALLDSPSIAGAYRFDIRPGEATVMTVHAALFPRKPIQKLGLAPLTSMYFYGFGDHKPPNFAFPAIHDSQGLLLHTGTDQWIWRALVNPDALRIDSFILDAVAGFGLMQRDRKPIHYDPGLGYARRPSAWVEPLGDWGSGQVELVQFRIPNETIDNIVAYWVSDQPPAPGERFNIAYRLFWQGNKPWHSPRGRVAHTLVGLGTDGARKYVIDFVGGELAALPADANIRSVAASPDAEVLENRVRYNPHTGGWRVILQVRPNKPDTAPVLRLRLTLDGRDVSETWDGLVLMPAQLAISPKDMPGHNGPPDH